MQQLGHRRCCVDYFEASLCTGCLTADISTWIAWEHQGWLQGIITPVVLIGCQMVNLAEQAMSKKT